MLSASETSKHNNPSKNYVYGISDKENGNFFQKMPTNITNKTDKHKLLKNKSIQTEKTKKIHQHKTEHLEQKKITESDYVYSPTKSKHDNNLNRKNWEMEPNKTKTAKKSVQYQELQKYQKDFDIRNKSDKSKSNASEREHVIQKETNSHTNSASRNHSELHRNQLEENSEVSCIISRYLNSRNEINMASVYSSLLPLLSQTNIPSEDSHTSETSVDFNKELFERLIVEVIHENLQNLHLTSEKNTVSDVSKQSLSKHTDEQSLEEKADQQDSLHDYDDDQQDSLQSDDDQQESLHDDDDDQSYSLHDSSKQNSSKSKTKCEVEQEISKSITTAGNNVELKEDSAHEMPFNYEKVLQFLILIAKILS
ncbi:DNA ligase 1-like [Centruroides sculpturatus]|uniref:DNA ligase 1-like n=1 Tax=Centruroides sculpturatus TaxID=218467 RepID=UPI000C6D9609|nr:DNA ligase 1-like [Centruroides sculpturatus]